MEWILAIDVIPGSKKARKYSCLINELLLDPLQTSREVRIRDLQPAVRKCTKIHSKNNPTDFVEQYCFRVRMSYSYHEVEE